MIFILRKAWAASSMISQDSLDSAMFSLSCLMPVPPVLGVPFLSITLSHSFLAATPSLRVATSSLTTSNSPRESGSLAASMAYLSIFSRSRLTPGTVSTRPSKEALIWNSLKRQAMTQAVVALERPTWSLMMIGVLMPVPTRFSQIVSKSAMVGAAVVTAPSSAYSPILLGGLAQMGVPLTYTLGSCLMFSQMILPSLGYMVPHTFSRQFLKP